MFLLLRHGTRGQSHRKDNKCIVSNSKCRKNTTVIAGVQRHQENCEHQKKRERRSSYHAWEKGLQAPSRSSTATYTAEKNLKTAKNNVEKMQSSRVTVQERKNNPWNKRERSEEVKRSESRENKKTPRESKPKTSKCVTLRRRKR